VATLTGEALLRIKVSSNNKRAKRKQSTAERRGDGGGGEEAPVIAQRHVAGRDVQHRCSEVEEVTQSPH